MAGDAQDHRRWRWWLNWTAPTAGLAVLACAALAIDHSVSMNVAQERNIPKLLHEVCVNVEGYGHLVGALCVAAAVYLVIPGGRHTASLAVTAALLGGGAANLIKLFVVRCRPRNFAFNGTVWDTFAPAADPFIKPQSFPSSHTAVAFAVSAVLAAAFPRARWLFWLLAAGVAGSRVFRLAHYPSDVCAGAAVGYAVGYLVATVGARLLRRLTSVNDAAPSASDIGHSDAGEPDASEADAGTSCPILSMRRAG